MTIQGKLETVARRLLGPKRPLAANGPPKHRRYLSDTPARQEAWLQAAREYVSRKDDAGRAWLYRKPYDDNPGHPELLHEMYSILNLLGAMAIPFRGRVLEVGSGPGWISEILMSLGYEVEGIEPSEEMIAIARERYIEAFRRITGSEPEL